AIGLAVAYLVTPFIVWVATRLRILAQPGGRHIHRVPVPRLGGLAIYLAFLAAVLAALPVERSIRVMVDAHNILVTIPFTPAFDQPVIGVLLGATMITIVGVLDDVRGISPMEKLFGQLVAAIIPLSFGVGMDVLTNPFGGMVFLGPFGVALTVL